MAILQLYHDVPAIDLGAEDYPMECFRPYTNIPWEEKGPYLGFLDPSHNPRTTSPDMYPTDRSAHLVNMEKHLLNLTNSAYGCGHSSAIIISKEEPPRLGLDTLWRSEGETIPTMPYLSPNCDSTLSSTISTKSDCAFSPDLSRHPTSLFRDELEWQGSFGSPYPVPFQQCQYSYSPRGSFYGQSVDACAPAERAVACTMKQLQYTPDPENEDLLEEGDCIEIETGPPKLAPARESHSPAFDKPSKSDYEDSIKDMDEEKSVDSDGDPEYSPLRTRSARKISNSKHPARSPTLPQPAFFKPTTEDARVLKPSQRQPNLTRRKAKDVSRRNSGAKNANRPFICSFSHYGCISRFSSKNEWKRHVASQHLQLGFYRCDTQQCNPDYHSPSSGNRPYNDFNRKDLFTQHHRRMHTPWSPANKPPSKRASDMFEDGLEEIRKRCWREKRQAPRSSRCIFCHLRFDGEGAWEERMEHVGKHFEKAEREKRDLGEGVEDPELRMWALQQGIVVDCGDRGCLLQGMQGGGGFDNAARTKRRKFVKVGEDDEDAVGDEE